MYIKSDEDIVHLSNQSQQIVHNDVRARHEVKVNLRGQESIEITEAP